MKDCLNWAFIATVIMLVILAAYASVKDKQAWQEFAKDHCEIVGETRTPAQPVFLSGPNGTSIGYVPGDNLTTYRCDDGKTYTR